MTHIGEKFAFRRRGGFCLLSQSPQPLVSKGQYVSHCLQNISVGGEEDRNNDGKFDVTQHKGPGKHLPEADRDRDEDWYDGIRHKNPRMIIKQRLINHDRRCVDRRDKCCWR